MAQAGIHALVGVVVGRAIPKRDWMVPGVIVGSIVPDLDNYAVAVATLAHQSTDGLHRTFTHSILAILLTTVLFVFIGVLKNRPRWSHFGVGLGIGIGLHIALDLLLWFDGVEILWPLGIAVDFWAGITPPAWFATLLEVAELAAFGMYFAWLLKAARVGNAPHGIVTMLRATMIATLGTWIVMTPLAFVIERGYQTAFGGIYLVALALSVILTIRLRKEIETATLGRVSQVGRPGREHAPSG